MDTYFSPNDEIWFLRVRHHISNAVYKKGAVPLRFPLNTVIEQETRVSLISEFGTTYCFNAQTKGTEHQNPQLKAPEHQNPQLKAPEHQNPQLKAPDHQNPHPVSLDLFCINIHSEVYKIMPFNGNFVANI
jgi:hypothetical protein